MSVQFRYWDSNVFLYWILPEPEKAKQCRGVINLAERGDLKIVTSALTLTEVIKLKGRPYPKAEQEKTISDFFENEFIVVRNVDPIIGEYARQLIWKYNDLHPKDSIHLATALKLKIPNLDTFDKGLIELDGKFSDPPIRIGPPNITYQEEIPY